MAGWLVEWVYCGGQLAPEPVHVRPRDNIDRLANAAAGAVSPFHAYQSVSYTRDATAADGLN